MRSPSACTTALFALVAALVPWRGGAAVYPDSLPPCNTTLQVCVDAQASGATVEIATNVPIVENISSTKGILLRPATGFTPTLQGSLLLLGEAAVTTYSVTGFTVLGGIFASPGTGNFAITVSDNSINAADGNGITITSGSLGPFGDVYGTIARNRVTTAGDGIGADCVGIAVTAPNDPGGLFMTVEDNEVTATGCDGGGGILGFAGGGSAMNLSLFRNRVNATGSNSGIGVEIDSGQTVALTTRLYGNFVFGQTGGQGTNGALWVEAVSSPASVLVANNTVVGNAGGLLVGADANAGGLILTGFVANNIVAFSSAGGLNLDDRAFNRNNLVFANTADFFTPGPGTIAADPALAATNDFHVLGNSPAINAGFNNAVDPGQLTDLDGEPRVQETIVDIGADEAPAASLVEVPTLDRRGLWICIVLLGLAALIGIRRNHS